MQLAGEITNFFPLKTVSEKCSDYIECFQNDL